MRGRLALVQVLTGERTTEWVRRKIAEAIDAQLVTAPGIGTFVRPDSPVYSRREDGTLVPITRALGGERVWILDTIHDLPHDIDPQGVGYFSDLTVVPGAQGCEARNVVLAAKDVWAGPGRVPTSVSATTT